MAERKQGLFGGLLRQAPGEDARSQTGDRNDPPAHSGPVEAYEEDWYRSLKALAAQRQLLAEEAEEEEEVARDAEEEATGEAEAAGGPQAEAGREAPEVHAPEQRRGQAGEEPTAPHIEAGPVS